MRDGNVVGQVAAIAHHGPNVGIGEHIAQRATGAQRRVIRLPAELARDHGRPRALVSRHHRHLAAELRIPAVRLVLAQGPVHKVLRLLAKRVRTHDAEGEREVIDGAGVGRRVSVIA